MGPTSLRVRPRGPRSRADSIGRHPGSGSREEVWWTSARYRPDIRRNSRHTEVRLRAMFVLAVVRGHLRTAPQGAPSAASSASKAVCSLGTSSGSASTRSDDVRLARTCYRTWMAHARAGARALLVGLVLVVGGCEPDAELPSAGCDTSNFCCCQGDVLTPPICVHGAPACPSTAQQAMKCTRALEVCQLRHDAAGFESSVDASASEASSDGAAAPGGD